MKLTPCLSSSALQVVACHGESVW